MNQKIYKSIVFDCDGVILNSNKIKTEAFKKTAIPYGQEAAELLVDYHLKNGGVSRYEKFKWFVQNVLDEKVECHLDRLVSEYAKIVQQELMRCEVAEGLEELKKVTSSANWFVVSGGDQAELRHVFDAKGLSSYFDGGIFGSPDDKDQILNREIKVNNISLPGLFIGDSQYDFEAAKRSGLDFIFLSSWTDFKNWKGYCNNNNIIHVKGLVNVCEFCA